MILSIGHSRISVRLAWVLFTVVTLSGCVGAAVGGGAAVGVAAYQERGVEGAARDLSITSDIRERWFRHDHTLATNVGVEVYEGRVLVTGAIPDPQMRADAVRIAWQADGVQEVINELQEVDSSVVNTARDTWITTQLETRITFDKDIYAVNYAIETVNDFVYLIGIAQNQTELDRVIAHAKDIKHVRKVISHVRIKTAT